MITSLGNNKTKALEDMKVKYALQNVKSFSIVAIYLMALVSYLVVGLSEMTQWEIYLTETTPITSIGFQLLNAFDHDSRSIKIINIVLVFIPTYFI